MIQIFASEIKFYALHLISASPKLRIHIAVKLVQIPVRQNQKSELVIINTYI